MGYKSKTKRYRRKRIISWTIFVVVILAALTIIFQVSWSYDKFLPGQKIDGLDVGLQTYSEAQEVLEQKYREQSVDLKVKERVVGSTTVEEIGIQVDAGRQIETAEFPLRERMIPGYFLYKIFFQDAGVPQLSLDTTATTSYLDRNYATVCTVSPVNASIVVEDDRLKLNSDESGLICDERKVIDNILVEDLTLVHPLSVKLDGKEIEALVREKDLQEIFDVTRTQLTNGIVFEVDTDKTISARYNDLVKWLNIETDIFGHVKISYSDDKIRDYLDKTISAFVKRTAGVTVVTEHNGIETSRKQGTEGRDLDYDGMIVAVKKYLDTNTEPDKKLAVTSKVTPPLVRYKRSFSKTIGGLMALFNNRLVGTNHSVLVDDLSGGGLSQSYNMSAQFESTSVNKLFVAYFMYDELKRNTGNVTESCFYKVLNSYDEECRANFVNNPQVGFASKMQLFTGVEYHDGRIITSAFGVAALLQTIQANVGSQLENLGGAKKFGISLMDIAGKDGIVSANSDTSDPVMVARIIKQGNNVHILVAVDGGDRDNLKETISLIEAIFTPES
jgi:hypothetical protein